jgi:hypothetical protein
VWKGELGCDMCHSPDWAMCLLLVFHHVVKDHEVQRLGTPEGKHVIGCIGSKTPEGPKSEVHIDR